MSRASELARRVSDGVRDFYLGEVPVHHIVALRILLGTIMFLQYLLYAPYMERLFGPEGLFRYLHGPSPVSTYWYVVWPVLLIAAFCYLIGFFTRISGAIVVVCHIAFHAQSYAYTWGDGYIGHWFIFYTLLSAPGARLSVDALIRRKREPDRPRIETVPAFPLRFLQVHISCVYFFAAFNRIHAWGWARGIMTFAALSESKFSRFPNVDWYPWKNVLWWATWYTLIMELAAPYKLWRKNSRTFWCLGLIAMHLGLELTSTIGWWQWYMMSVLTTFFPSRWVIRAVEGAERRLRIG